MSNIAPQRLSPFEEQLAALLKNNSKPSYDIMQYDDFFIERPPAIQKQNHFSNYERSKIVNSKIGLSSYQYGGSKLFEAQNRSLNVNERFGPNLGQSKISGGRERSVLEEFMKPEYSVNESYKGSVTNALSGLTSFRVQNANPYELEHIEGIAQQPKVNNLNMDRKVSNSNVRESPFGKNNGLNATGTFKGGNVGRDSARNDLNYSNLFKSNGPIPKQDSNYDKSENPARSQRFISKSPQKDSHIHNNNHVSGIETTKRPNNSPQGSKNINELLNLHTISRKVSSR